MMRLMVMMMEEPRHRDPSTPQWSHRERQVPGVSSSLEAMLAAPEVNVENLCSRLVVAMVMVVMVMVMEAMLAAPEVNVENLGSRLVIMVTISDF